jgi:predicted transcriptional regulator
LDREKDKLAGKLILFVKLVAIATFLFVFLFFLPITLAQVQYYGIDVALEESGRAKVELTITFFEPEKEFEFSILGRMEKFNASSMGIPVDCSLKLNGISEVKCKLNLTQERRTIKLNFETNDFVRRIGENDYFDADLSLNKNIDNVFASIKLPEGCLVSEEMKGGLSFPENVTILSDGRHHIITWKLEDLEETQSLRLQILYEKVQTSLLSQTFFYAGIFVLVAIFITISIYLKFLRKPEEIMLSVLDEFERKVMDAITQAGGTVNQKKVVQATNLSKAKVSRVVKSLAERGLIEVERLGRTNRLKIVKKGFKLFKKVK